MTESITTEELNKEISAGSSQPLPLLPEREWLEATIVDVNYQCARFNGEIQYVTDKNDNLKRDEEGNLIERREFQIVFELSKFSLENGNPHPAWLRLSPSLHKKAHLPKFLRNVGIDVEGVTPKKIIDDLRNMKVRLQLATKDKQDGSGQYQVVVYDAVQCLDTDVNA